MNRLCISAELARRDGPPHIAGLEHVGQTAVLENRIDASAALAA